MKNFYFIYNQMITITPQVGEQIQTSIVPQAVAQLEDRQMPTVVAYLPLKGFVSCQ
ncbi:MAG: hypothetical protein LUC91_00265 [Prevotella sp.]|nr:hypothetical protein [Prevotella sp.]